MSRLKDKPFEIVGLSVDESRRELMNVIRHIKPPGIQAWDYSEGVNPVAKTYNVHDLSTSYLLDGNGIIRVRDPEAEKLVSAVEAILKAGE